VTNCVLPNLIHRDTSNTLHTSTESQNSNPTIPAATPAMTVVPSFLVADSPAFHPVALSLDLCRQEYESWFGWLDTNSAECSNPTYSSDGTTINTGDYVSECDAFGLICAYVKCCNICIEEGIAYGTCLMTPLQCGGNQCSSSHYSDSVSAASNALVVTIFFVASLVGFGTYARLYVISCMTFW
jgi:hypothetical protein